MVIYRLLFGMSAHNATFTFGFLMAIAKCAQTAMLCR